MKRFRVIAGAALAAAVVLLAAVPAWARVSQISIEVEDVINEGEELVEPEITVSGCEIEDIDWSKDVSKWKPASRVTATLTLTSDDTFAGKYNSSTIRVKGGDYSSSTKVDDNTLKVRITYTPKVQLGMTEKAGWSSSNPNKAVWKKVPFATAYQLRLYREGALIQTLTVRGTSVDLSEYMTQEAYYYYEVRAMGRDTAERQFLLSGEYVESEETLMDEETIGEVDGTWRNYQEGSRYYRADGTNPVSAWLQISGDWYYFDANGYMTTGWQNVGGLWYYLGTDGKMATGWQEINGIWYYLDDSGKMITGWVETKPGYWYYLNADGSMAVNTTVDGQYYVDASGRWVA